MKQQERLSSEDFLASLGKLFQAQSSSAKGSIYLTQKRLSYGSENETLPSESSSTAFADLSPSKPLPVLIRATNGKSKDARKDKIKLATVVQSDELDVFFQKYAEVCRAGFSSGLKKRDRSKGKKKKKDGKKAEVKS